MEYFCSRSDEMTPAAQFIAASKFLAYFEYKSSEAAQEYAQVVGAGNYVFAQSTSMRVTYHRPTTTLIADLGDARLALRGRLPVLIEPAGNRFVAYSLDLDELALGDDESSAVADMKASIVESYFLLKEEQDALGPLQQKHWNFLKRLVQEVG